MTLQELVRQYEDPRRLMSNAEADGYVVCGSDGFECTRMNHPTNVPIMKRIDEGTMNAKGTGGWKDCAWQGIYYEPEKHNAQRK